MKRSKIFWVYCLIMSVAINSGCSSKKSFDPDVEYMNKGTLNIYADESYRVLVDELIQSYENVYPGSDIIPTYTSDAELLTAMLNDKTRMVITGRTLTKQEIDAISKVNELVPKQYVIGKEAIAVITSINNTDSIFNIDEFIKSRAQGYRGIYSETSFVFNKQNTDMIAQLLGYQNNNFTNLFSLDNTDTLVAYIAANPKAIGFMSFAELSDTDDPAVAALLKTNKILAVSKADTNGAAIVTDLSQSTLATNKYPLLRNVTVIKGNTSELLGTGFVNFLYRSKASRIMLKAGLIPEKMTERQIQVID